MKRCFLIVFAALHTISVQGQIGADELEFEFGPMFRLDKRSVPTQFVGADSEHIYMVYSRGKSGDGRKFLHKFGYDLKPKELVELSSTIDSRQSKSETVLMLDGKIYQVAHTRSGNERTFYVQPIDKVNLAFGEAIPIGSFTPEGRGLKQSDYFISATKDSSYISVIYTIPNKRDENEQFVVNVFNKEMEKVWSEQFMFPDENQLLDLREFRMDMQGNLYALAKRRYDSSKDKVFGFTQSNYLLFNLDREGGMDSLKIETEGKFLRDMKVAITPEGDIVSAGFYSYEKKSGAMGAYYIRLDGKTNEVVSSSFKDFGLDLVLQNMTKEQAKRVQRRIQRGRSKELPNYRIDELIALADGSVRMIGEQRRVYTTKLGTGPTAPIETHFVYNDMVIVSISEDGEVQWTERIAKRQHTINDAAAYSSYALMKLDNELVLMFNDNPRNVDYDGEGKVAEMRKNNVTMVMAARVGQFGDVKRSGLFRRGEVEIKIRPVFAHQLDEDELLLFGHRQVRDQRFVIVKFR